MASMSRPAAAAFLTAAVVVVGAATVLATTPGPPRDVCSVCGDAFERFVGDEIPDAAEEIGVDDRDDYDETGYPRVEGLDVVDSDATVRLTDDGDARWRVENTVKWTDDDAVEEVTEESDLLAEYTRAQLPDDAEDVTVRTTVNGTTAVGRTDTITVEYVTPDAGREQFGDTVVLTLLHGGISGVNITVDRFSVVAPPETAITTDVDSATVEGRTATWQGKQLVDTYVAFVPADALFPEVRTYFAFVTLQSPIGTGSTEHLVSAGVLFVLLAGLVGVHAALGINPTVLGGLGAVPALLVFLGVFDEVTALLAGNGTLTALPYGVSLVVLGAGTVRLRRQFRRGAGTERSGRRPQAVAALATASGLLLSTLLVVSTGVRPVAPESVYLVLLTVPLGLTFPLGYVAVSADWSRRLKTTISVTVAYALVFYISGPVPDPAVLVPDITSVFLPVLFVLSALPAYALGGVLAHTVQKASAGGASSDTTG